MSKTEISADQLIATYREENIARVKLAFADLDGVHRGKYISLDKFPNVLEHLQSTPLQNLCTFGTVCISFIQAPFFVTPGSLPSWL